MNKNFISTTSTEYEDSFNIMLRGRASDADFMNLRAGKNTVTGTFELPKYTEGKFRMTLNKESIFRVIATTMFSRGDGNIYAYNSEDIAAWVPEGGQIPIRDGEDDYTRHPVSSHKLSAIIRLAEDFVQDAAWNVSKHLTIHMAKAFARAEEKAFIEGTGNHEPVGILHAEKGAETGVTTSALTFDDVIGLYFSLKAEYRRNGKWLMNDVTAEKLRKLKDADGNHLWNQADNTILGKEVIISEFMPDEESGKCPVAFGDFSYYWIIDRDRAGCRLLNELFAVNQQVGYLGNEFIDGMLVRPEAVKTIKMA